MKRMLKNALLVSWAAGMVWVGCTVEEDGDDDDATSSSTTSTGSSTGSSTSSSSSSTSTSTSTTSTSTTSTSTTSSGAVTYDCNPVTGEPCGSGEGCDLSSDGAFVCFQPPNDQEACEVCDNGNGPWCINTFSCNGGDNTCRRYCCDAGDCAPSQTCDTSNLNPVGVCMGGGSGGSGGGGGGVPGCDDVPVVAPSTGSCVPM